MLQKSKKHIAKNTKGEKSGMKGQVYIKFSNIIFFLSLLIYYLTICLLLFTDDDGIFGKHICVVMNFPVLI